MVSPLDELDTIDKKIIELLQKDPEMSHADIGKVINKSQPAVGARILKLIRKGVVGSLFGFNFKSSNLPLLTITLESNDTSRIYERVETCPFILNVFSRTGQSNAMILATASSIDKYNEILDKCLRRDKTISHIDPAIVIKVKKDLILPLNFNIDFYEKINCANDCPFKEKVEQIKLSEKTAPIAEHLSEYQELKLYFDKMLDSIRNFSSCDGIGIRLIDQNGFIAFYVWKGLKDDFFRSENHLSLNDCLCGRVCRGDTLENIFTSNGSFLTNNMTSSMDIFSEDLKKCIRGKCISEGYESLLLIPLKTEGKILGLLYLAAYKKDAFPEPIVKNLESFANLITNAIVTITFDTVSGEKKNQIQV